MPQRKFHLLFILCSHRLWHNHDRSEAGDQRGGYKILHHHKADTAFYAQFLLDTLHQLFPFGRRRACGLLQPSFQPQRSAHRRVSSIAAAPAEPRRNKRGIPPPCKGLRLDLGIICICGGLISVAWRVGRFFIGSFRFCLRCQSCGVLCSWWSCHCVSAVRVGSAGMIKNEKLLVMVTGKSSRAISRNHAAYSIAGDRCFFSSSLNSQMTANSTAELGRYLKQRIQYHRH